MNLGDLKLDKQKKILIAIFLILIVYVDGSYILKAQTAGLKSLDPKIAKLKMDLASLNQGLENMRLNKNKLSPGAPQKAISSSRILAENQLSQLLQEISNFANKLNIKISLIRPSHPAKEKSALAQNKLNPVLINLDLVSDYHNLGKFLQALENSAIFMEVEELEITAQQADYLKQKITLVLKTYVTK